MAQNDVVAVSSEEKKPEHVQTLKVLKIERNPEKVLKSLTPNVRKCVEKLQEIQKKHDNFEEKFIEESNALKAKYYELYQPLYSERSQILNGSIEVEGVVADKPEEKGVPEFWLTVLKANAILAQEITKRDEGALKYLNDIKSSQFEKPKGFTLEFFFDTNPYFKNAVLTKSYHLVDVDDSEISKVIGTEIEWYPEQHLTKKLIRRKSKTGGNDDKPITKFKDYDSFFNYFKPLQIPDNVENLDDEETEDLQYLLVKDYEMGATFRDDIIPHAVSWFTGEASNDDEDVIVVDDEDEDSDDEDDEEDEKAAEN